MWRRSWCVLPVRGQRSTVVTQSVRSDRVDDQFVKELYKSSPLHDIGKVGVEDAVLLKAGRLDAEELGGGQFSVNGA